LILLTFSCSLTAHIGPATPRSWFC